MRYGDPAQQTTFDSDPTAVAHRWAAAGTRWLHVVNLDGALEETGTAANLACLSAISQVGPAVQFGGGLRSLADIERAISLGATRIVLGTIAVTQPNLLQTAVQQFGPAKIAVGLDARDGRIHIRGWQQDSGRDIIELGRQVRAAGVEIVIHTDIGRDGDLTGVNGPASAALAQATGLQVIASGGVSSTEDVRRLRHLPGITGVIIGRALYEGKINLEELIRET